MINKELFRYSINFKAAIFLAVCLSIILISIGILMHFSVFKVSIYIWLFSIFVIFLVLIAVFIYYITIPLGDINKAMLYVQTERKPTTIKVRRNDELGVIANFFNEVVDAIQGVDARLDAEDRMSKELQMAAKIQKDVFPKNIPDNIIGLDIIAKSKPCSEVGGDCFDFLKQNNDTIIYIGDVTGHGTAASLIMMLVNSVIKALMNESINAREVLAKTNRVLYEKISSQHFMTLAMLRWQNDRQRMSYIGAGHEYILHYSAESKEVNRIKTGGVALKMLSSIDRSLVETDIPFKEGDVLLLYTDGITEFRKGVAPTMKAVDTSSQEMFGVNRLQTALLQNAFRKPEDIFDKITEEFATFLGPYYEQQDDVTMIIIKNIGQFTKSTHRTLSIYQDKSQERQEGTLWGWQA